ncbi:hypothetical protein [Nesterenkonia muleiensis]|uniref:hypothetical protein n=1 Tax=Nesterenkonia muleiensis TaxID=2282648 RepID=UPI000E72C219|nr:hypothetical protein [Nesterenkonia muleiensis]
MTDTQSDRLRLFHDDLVRAVSSTPGVARLVPSYREMLSRSARAVFGNDVPEASGIDIVVRRAGTTIYADFYADRGFSTGTITDAVHETVHKIAQADCGADSPGGLSGWGDITIKVRILGIS